MCIAPCSPLAAGLTPRSGRPGKVFKQWRNSIRYAGHAGDGPWVHGGWAHGKAITSVTSTSPPKNTPFFNDNVLLPFFRQYLKSEGNANLPPRLDV